MTHPSITPPVHHATHPSITPSVHHVTHLSVTPSICHVTCLSVTLPVHHVTHPSITDHLSTHLSSSTTEHQSATSQSLPNVNGEQSCQAKESIHVDPPKSGEDPCKTCEIMGDLGLSTLSLPRFMTCPSIDPSVCHTNCPSDSPSLSDCMHGSMPHPSPCPLSTTTYCLSTTSQSQPFMNREHSHQSKNSIGPSLAMNYFSVHLVI